MLMHIRNKAFTIVELLLAIVIISILTTITVVAFSRVQQRSQASVYAANASQWERAIRAYYVLTGFPPGISSSSPELYGYKIFAPDVYAVCLGKAADYPATAQFSAGSCQKELYLGDNTTTETYGHDSVIQDLVSQNISVPTASLPVVRADVTSQSVDPELTYTSRGILYNPLVPNQQLKNAGVKTVVNIYWASPYAMQCGSAASFIKAYETEIAEQGGNPHNYGDQCGPNYHFGLVSSKKSATHTMPGSLLYTSE